MEIKVVPVRIPDGANIVVGQSHFIKTVEDLYEILAATSPQIKFGVAFSEASGPCLIRHEGNDPELTDAATWIASNIAAGHIFVILLRDAFPINILNAVKMCQEVCHIYCATANPLQILVAETDQGRGIIGVVDGASPRGTESDADKAARKALLRNFGYKVKP